MKAFAQKWMWNPFEYVAGAKALLAAIVLNVLIVIISVLAQVRFDGVIDAHLGKVVTWPLAFFEVFMVWLILAGTLTISGLIVSESHFRAVDVFGTTGLARWPLILIDFVSWPVPMAKINLWIKWKLTGQGNSMSISSLDITFLVIMAIVSLVGIIYMVVLIYRAYSVSCNVTKTKGVVSFIIALIISEVISKLVIYASMNYLFIH